VVIAGEPPLDDEEVEVFINGAEEVADGAILVSSIC
jgi:hypothetical protein